MTPPDGDPGLAFCFTYHITYLSGGPGLVLTRLLLNKGLLMFEHGWKHWEVLLVHRHQHYVLL